MRLWSGGGGLCLGGSHRRGGGRRRGRYCYRSIKPRGRRRRRWSGGILCSVHMAASVVAYGRCGGKRSRSAFHRTFQILMLRLLFIALCASFGRRQLCDRGYSRRFTSRRGSDNIILAASEDTGRRSMREQSRYGSHWSRLPGLLSSSFSSSSNVLVRS